MHAISFLTMPFLEEECCRWSRSSYGLNISKTTGLQSLPQGQTAFGNVAGSQIRQLVQFCCGKARECFAQMEQEPLLVSVIACDVNQAEHSLPRQCWKGRTLFLISVNFYWERFYKLRPFFHSCLPSYDFNTLKLVLDWFTYLDSKVSLNSDDSNFIIFMIPVHVFKEFFNTFESENMRDLFQATRRWNTVKFAQVVHLIFVQITE